MAQVLGSTLRIEVHVRARLIVKVTALVKLIGRVVHSTLLQCVEHVQAVILVEFEGLGDFFRA